MNITTSYELVIIPATIAMGLSVQEPDIGAKNIAITVPIPMASAFIDPVVVGKKNTYPSPSVLSAPMSIEAPEVYANTFSNPSPFNLSLTLLQPTIYTQTNILPSAFSTPMTLETPTIVANIAFLASNYGNVFAHFNIEQTPYTANSSGFWSTANAGYPGEEISYWHSDYGTPGERTFLDLVYDYVRLQSKTTASQNGNITTKYGLFNGSTHMDGSLTTGTTLGSFMNNRSAITICMVVEPFQSASGSNRFLLHCFNSGSTSRLQLGLYYSSVGVASLYGSISRNGAGATNFTIGDLYSDQKAVIMLSANFTEGWLAGYINNSRTLYNTIATFGGGSGNTDAVDSTKIIMGGLWSTGAGAVVFNYYGNLYHNIMYQDTSLADNNREQIFRSLGAYYGITQSARNY